MKRFASFAALIVCLAIGQVQAQNQKKLLHKQERQEQKAQEEFQDSLLFRQAYQAIDGKSFTLEAGQVVFKGGQTAFVSTSTNFISVDGDMAVVQIAFNGASSGLNGLGGITVKGSVSGYRVKTDKAGNVYVSMNVVGTAVSATVSITLYNGSNQASVTVNPNFNSNRLTLNGKIVPFSKSTVFQGTAY